MPKIDQYASIKSGLLERDKLVEDRVYQRVLTEIHRLAVEAISTGTDKPVRTKAAPYGYKADGTIKKRPGRQATKKPIANVDPEIAAMTPGAAAPVKVRRRRKRKVETNGLPVTVAVN